MATQWVCCFERIPWLQSEIKSVAEKSLATNPKQIETTGLFLQVQGLRVYRVLVVFILKGISHANTSIMYVWHRILVSGFYFFHLLSCFGLELI